MHGADDRVVIASSKTKLLLIIAGALLFVATGVWLLAIADTQRRYPPLYVEAVSVAAIAFFGLCAIYGLIKLLDRSPGLVLDREGIIDNSSALAAGRVRWNEINDIRVVTVSGQRFLAVFVADPGRYLGRGNALIRWFVSMNYKLYGTPIFIASHSLKAKFEDLEKQVRDYRARLSGVRTAGDAPP
jgi:hypothetical protein